MVPVRRLPAGRCSERCWVSALDVCLQAQAALAVWCIPQLPGPACHAATSATVRCRLTETGQGHATSAAQQHQLLCRDVQVGLLRLDGQQQAPVERRPAPGAGCKAHAGDQPPSPGAVPHQAQATAAATFAEGQPAPGDRPGCSRGNQVAASQLSPPGVLLACREHLVIARSNVRMLAFSACTGAVSRAPSGAHAHTTTMQIASCAGPPCINPAPYHSS